MKFLYGYSVAAELRPATRTTSWSKALGCDGELVRDPERAAAGAGAGLRARAADAGQRPHRPRGRLPAQGGPGLVADQLSRPNSQPLLELARTRGRHPSRFFVHRLGNRTDVGNRSASPRTARHRRELERVRRRQLLCVGLAVAATAITAGAVNAQAGGVVGGVTGGVKNTTGSVKDTVGNTVKDTTGTVKDTTGSVKDTVGNTVGTVTGGGGSSGGSSGGGGGGTTTTGSSPPPSGSGTGTTGTGASGGGGSGSQTTSGDAGPGGRRASGGSSHGGAHGRNGGTAMPAHPMAMSQAPQQKPNGVPTRFNPSLSVATPTPSPFGQSSFMIGQFEIPRSCFRYTRPAAAKAQASLGRCSPRSTRSRPPSARISTSRPPRAPRGGCSSCRRRGERGASTPTATVAPTRTTPLTRSAPPPATCRPPAETRTCARPMFAYNHASWYVDEVLLTAQQYGKLPDGLVGSLTGLTGGGPPPSPRSPATPSRRAPHRSTPQRAAARPGRAMQGSAGAAGGAALEPQG